MKRILLLLYLFLTVPLLSQEDKLQLEEEAWQEMTKDLDYEEADEEDPEEEVGKTAGTGRDRPFNAAFWRPVLFAIIIILALIVIIRLIIKAKQPGHIRKERIEARTLEEAEENLPGVTLDSIYSEALEARNYKSALRIKFLMILQRMIDEGMIEWKKRKTNEQYLDEITDTGIKTTFAGIVKVFDDMWYGNRSISPELFEKTNGYIDELNRNMHG